MSVKKMGTNGYLAHKRKIKTYTESFACNGNVINS
jgi:hypothetical protein